MRPAPTLPAPAALSTAERLRLLAAFETVLGGVYTHLPLKRARYGFDPVQRLRILRSEVKSFDDNAFHVALAAIVTQMRDYHTRYTWPAAFAGKVAVLPFLVEMYGPDEAPTYIVTKVGRGPRRRLRPRRAARALERRADRPRRRPPRRRGMRRPARRLALGVAAEPHLPRARVTARRPTRNGSSSAIGRAAAPACPPVRRARCACRGRSSIPAPRRVSLAGGPSGERRRCGARAPSIPRPPRCAGPRC
jgi:hypothetical protein